MLTNRITMPFAHAMLDLLVATFSKGKIQQVKLILSDFYVFISRHVSNMLVQHTNVKIPNEVFYMLFLVLSLQNLLCFLHLQQISILSSDP